MYRCYLIRNGRIAWGEDLDCDTTDDAKAGARALWISRPDSNSFTGLEVWKGATLVHLDGCRAGEPCPIASPFETGESTIYSTWRPTTARPIGMSVMMTHPAAPVPSEARSVRRLPVTTRQPVPAS
jgi:hypothetical protein